MVHNLAANLPLVTTSAMREIVCVMKGQLAHRYRQPKPGPCGEATTSLLGWGRHLPPPHFAHHPSSLLFALFLGCCVSFTSHHNPIEARVVLWSKAVVESSLVRPKSRPVKTSLARNCSKRASALSTSPHNQKRPPCLGLY